MTVCFIFVSLELTNFGSSRKLETCNLLVEVLQYKALLSSPLSPTPGPHNQGNTADLCWTTINSAIPLLSSGEGLPYERGGDARRKFWIKHLEETNLGVAQPFLDP